VYENPLAPEWLRVPGDVDGFAAQVWPTGIRRDSDGVTVIGGVRVTDLAAHHGTPLYVLDEGEVRARARRVRDALDGAFQRIGSRAQVYYAGKAFLSIELVRWMVEAGLRIDVASGGELAVALAAGIDPALIGMHGNNKSWAELDRAARVGVGTVVIDSEQEIERVAAAASAHGRVQRVRLRVRSGVHAHTHDFLATAHEDQKFGVSLSRTEELVARIRAFDSMEFVGLHCHIGSQIFGADGFAESAARLIAVHARLLAGGPVPELNLGGGFGIAYTSADDPDEIERIATRIADTVAAECARAGIAVPVVAFEPGRWIVGPAGVTLYTVGTTKAVDLEVGGTAAQRLYVSIDGGMSDNARPALYGADYAARVVGRTSEAAPVLVRVAGKHCESGDIVVDADYLPGDVAPGDLLAVAATGAYCWSLASNYNLQPRPAVVAVRDGAHRVLVRGESEHDLLARDAGERGATATRAGEER
jgi:diaminopimelate decarboxylase